MQYLKCIHYHLQLYDDDAPLAMYSCMALCTYQYENNPLRQHMMVGYIDSYSLIIGDN